MKIYINDYLHPVRAEILPNDTPTQDETLETFSFALISNSNPLPYAPMNNVKVDFTGDETDVAYFYIQNDSVETYSLNPLRYKHNITCVQNTRILSKHQVRNSVFTQPAYLTKKSFNSQSRWASAYAANTDITFGNPYISTRNWGSKKLSLDVTHNERIKGVPQLKISFQYVQRFQEMPLTPTIGNFVHSDALDTSDIIQNIPSIQSLSVVGSMTLHYTIGGVAQTPITITPADLDSAAFLLNWTYNFPLIKELADNGGDNFEIYFDSDDFITGRYGTYSGLNDSDQVPSLRFYMVQVELIAETYYFTAYDILEKLLQRQGKRTSMGYKVSPLFKLPANTIYFTENQRELAKLLQNTVAPNFTFTDLTMYECVAEVFRLFDGIFTMDMNGTLGIDYFNDLSNGEIKSGKFTGRTTALGEDKYVNGLMANYQDARVVESFPREKGKYAYLRCIEFGVPEAQDFNFIVPHNIQSIVKCELLTTQFETQSHGGDPGFTAVGELPIDITDQVFEQSVWSELDTGTLSFTDRKNEVKKQANTIFYVEGSNALQVATSFKNSWGINNVWCLYNAANSVLTRMGGMDVSDELLGDDNLINYNWGYVRMRLTYIASVDGKTEVHSLTNKYPGETMIDQANGAVDLNKLGLNMLGLSLKLGNPTLNATHKISKWADRIKVGQTYTWEGKLWVANVVNYTFFGGCVQGKVSFVENFNALSLRTQLLREKRMTNISKGLVRKSEEIITDYVYFSTEQIDAVGTYIHFDEYQFLLFVYTSFHIEQAAPKMNDAFVYTIFDAGVTDTTGIYIPMIRYGAGNTINFEMSFDHPMNAGNQTKAKNQWVGENLPNNRKYFTTHCLYTDDAGFLDEIYIKTPVQTDTYDTNFPKVTFRTEGTYNFAIYDYHVYKQPNEIFALNYQLAFLPVPGRENVDFIGSWWINNNCFVKDYDYVKRNLYIVFRDEKISVLESTYLPKDSDVVKKILLCQSYTYSNHRFQGEYGFTPWELADEAESWLIVDDDNNILFGSNKKLEANTGRVSVYFMTSYDRLV